MRVNKQKIKYELNEQDGEVVLSLEPPSSRILEFIQIENYSGWIKRRLSKVYYIVSEDNSPKVTFTPIFLLQTIDPTPLKELMTELLDQFVVYRILYDVSIYAKQMKVIRSELKNYHPCRQDQNDEEQKVVFSIKATTENDKEEEMVVFCHRKICETVMEEKVHRLNKFVQQTAVYDLEDYFYKKGINPKEQKAFVKGLIEFYKDNLANHLQDKMKPYGMEHQILIKDIQPYLMDDRGNENSNMKGRAGIHFTFYCFQEAVSKMYQIFDKWINKLNWMALEVKQIFCCRPEDVQKHFLRNYNQNVIRLSSKSHEKIIVFEPKQSRQDFEKILGTCKRLITGLEFPDKDFSTIFQFKKQFENYIADDQTRLPRPTVYEDYLLVQCDKSEESKLRSKIASFLQDYKWVTVDIEKPSGQFQIGIFTQFYSHQIEVEIRFITQEEPEYKVQRQNLKKCSERVEIEIKELYNKMRRQLITKPLMKPFNKKLPLYRILPAPEWKHPECLKSLKFTIDDQINLLVRSYGSIANEEGNCIFILYEPDECFQFRQILEEEGMTYIKQKYNKNPIMSIQLKYSPFFDGIMTWLFNPQNVSNRRDQRWVRRMKIEMEQFLSDCKNMSNINFMLPKTCPGLIDYFLPCLIETAQSECKASNLRQITLFTSLASGPELRNSISISLKSLSGRMSVKRVSELLLLRSDIEKIIEYKYYNLKYLDQHTEEATPLNSFIFKHQRDKRIRTPIFLPSAASFRSRNLIEFLVCIESNTYFMIKGRRIDDKQYSLGANKQLKMIVKLVCSIFVRQNYLVVYGSEKGNQFDCRLFMTSDHQSDYRKLSELEIDFAEGKVRQLNKRLQYEVIEQEYIDVYKVQTHPSLAQELHNLINK